MKQLTFASLQVTDLAASIDFYTNTLRFETEQVNPQACVFRYNKGQASFAIRTPLEPLEGKELGTGVAIWFDLDEDLDGFREELNAGGVASVGPVITTPFGRAFHVKDPDGYKLTFLESK